MIATRLRLLPMLAGFLLAWPPAVCQQADAPKALQDLRTGSQQQLDQSILELNRLRDQIATERLPLAQELTALEERVTQQRQTHDEKSRLVDNGNLAVANLKTEMKGRQDNLAYIGGLLDEYARGFEAKVHVSELQYCGSAIDAAKQATENTSLSMEERFARQVDFAKLSTRRLQDAIGGMRFPGVGVDTQGSVVQGQFALLGPVALFGAAGGTAGLVVAQTGSSKPLIRPLEGKAQEQLGNVVQQGEGVMPFDPSSGSALKDLINKTNLIHIFEKGGPIMWPLLVASVLALGTVVERLLFLMNERRKRDPRALDMLFGAVEHGKLGAAVELGKKSKDFVLRTLGYALEHRERSLSNALLLAQSRELKRFRRGIPILDTVITLAPLLGLLGTVTGMMGSFSIIGGELSSPGAITGGIAEALIATAFGLGIAITALLPFNFLNARLDEASSEIESASKQLELLVHPHAGAATVDLDAAQAIAAAGS